MITSFILLFIIIVVVVVGVILGNLCCRWFSLYRWCCYCCRWWWWEAVTEAPTDMCNCLERWEGDISRKLFVNLSVSSLSLDCYQLLLFYIFIRPRCLGTDVWVRSSVRRWQTLCRLNWLTIDRQQMSLVYPFRVGWGAKSPFGTIFMRGLSTWA